MSTSEGLLRVSLIAKEEAADWDRYVRGQQSATIYHLHSWRDLITDVFQRETYYLAAKQDTRISGVLPLVRLKSIIFGDFLVSLPYVNYGGVLADSSTAAQALIMQGCQIADDLNVRHMELRHTVDYDELETRRDKVSMHLQLQHDSDLQWKMLGSKLRAQIKRPQRENAVCEIGGVELVDNFYGVFAEKYRDLGTPVYSRLLFSSILRRFPDAAKVVLIKVDGVAVAASIVLGFGGKLEVPWAASVRSADRFGVNMLLYWSMIKFAIEAGYHTFDFGRSTPDSGTYRFKKQWGAQPVALYWHYFLRNGSEMPRLNAGNPKYRLAIGLWKRMPVWLANVIGPRIVKNLP